MVLQSSPKLYPTLKGHGGSWYLGEWGPSVFKLYEYIHGSYAISGCAQVHVIDNFKHCGTKTCGCTIVFPFALISSTMLTSTVTIIYVFDRAWTDLI